MFHSMHTTVGTLPYLWQMHHCIKECTSWCATNFIIFTPFQLITSDHNVIHIHIFQVTLKIILHE